MILNFKRQKTKTATESATLPEVNFSDWGDVRTLHLGTPWIQGSMLIDAPFDIELEYVQRMMAWLLFVELDTVAQRKAMQLGLGAATCTKFCYKKLRMHTTAIEINSQVVSACRLWFKLPPDEARLQVVVADAALEIKKPKWQGQIDALQVDLYDQEAAAPVLDSSEFYADCKQLLTDDGIMTVNLFGRSSSFQSTVDKITGVFGADAVWAFKATREGNTIVLAQSTGTPVKREALQARAIEIESKYGLPASKWLRVFKSIK
ncbi:MAG TPA: spermidine synthase [Burkholderiaceae bacterium]|nr:spermidine synthase [Burkholderiaceae bacterium]